MNFIVGLDIPCHGDIFHIKRQYQKMLLSVERLGIKAIRFREKIEDKITKINRGNLIVKNFVSN